MDFLLANSSNTWKTPLQLRPDLATVSGSLVVTGSFAVITGSAVELQVTNTGVNIGNALTDTHNVTGSLAVTGSIGFASTSIILSRVSSSLNFADDTAAAAGGIPLGGLYRNGNFIAIRLT
jgi:hypothetical protein